MWCAFEEPNDYRVVRQPDGLTGPTHFVQIEVLDPELRALLRVSDGKAEMPNRAKLYFHVRILLVMRRFVSAVIPPSLISENVESTAILAGSRFALSSSSRSLALFIRKWRPLPWPPLNQFGQSR